ncbi:MAG TPA: TraR/DksA family transcriptional regulator [Thermoanaerobaculia bacterium]|nr:TraR/DksA family transcriptional regulator [Thermoanaerobaculia bacterium]HUM29363.1 TraR/DksA family transcriptional regulator [Thermoanaerobaculia bacterium]HXK67609.1 TraR/DksA family transcriptional regulator [Thermoanaerobaculia bacterium]
MNNNDVRIIAMDSRKLKKYRAMLEERREQIIRSEKEWVEEEIGTAANALDSGDKALSSYEKEFHYQLTDNEQKLLKLIDEAMKRMESSNYGLCVECSKPIQEARLNAIPWARHCVSCQELQEKGLIP